MLQDFNLSGIKDFLKSKLFDCRHYRITSKSKAQFCPDCGQRIVLKWFVAVCQDCSYKRETSFIFGKPQPKQKKCPVCDCKTFHIELSSALKQIDLNNCAVSREPIRPDGLSKRFEMVLTKAENSQINAVKNNFSFKGLFAVHPDSLKKFH